MRSAEMTQEQPPQSPDPFVQAQSTLMYREAGASPALAAQQLAANAGAASALGTLLRTRKPRAVRSRRHFCALFD